MSAVLAVCLLFVPPTTPAVPEETRPPAPQPQPQVSVVSVAPALSHRRQVTGSATWYDYHPGQAAAGPALRRALGDNWRGQSVDVCLSGTHTCIHDIRLTDWCWCPHGNRVIDLDVRDFASLAPTWRGVLKVEVRPS